jgi:hypothetical protein
MSSKTKFLFILILLSIFIIVALPPEVRATTCAIDNYPELISVVGSKVTTSCVPPYTLQSMQHIHNAAQSFGSYFFTFLKMITVLSGSVSTLLIVKSGWTYLLSGGNVKHVQDAKSGMFHAAIGLFISSGAFIILNLIGKIVGIGF